MEWLAAHVLRASRDLHLLSLAVGVLLSLLTHKTELIVRGVYGKTQCIALLAAFFALHGHQVYYVSRQNTTIVAMAIFVQELLPQDPMRGPLPFGSCPTHTLARVKARILMPVTPTKTSRSGMPSLSWPPQGSILRFRQPHRPLAKAVDYADLFIYNQAQQEAALSDPAILGALLRKCLALRLGDPKQTSEGTGPVILHVGFD